MPKQVTVNILPEDVPLSDKELEWFGDTVSKSTPPPWIMYPDSRPTVHGPDNVGSGYFGEGALLTFAKYGSSWDQKYENLDDALFVVMARAFVPRLLHEIAALRAVPPDSDETQCYAIIGAFTKKVIGVTVGDSGKAEVLSEEPSSTNFVPITREEYDLYTGEDNAKEDSWLSRLQ